MHQGEPCSSLPPPLHTNSLKQTQRGAISDGWIVTRPLRPTRRAHRYMYARVYYILYKTRRIAGAANDGARAYTRTFIHTYIHVKAAAMESSQRLHAHTLTKPQTSHGKSLDGWLSISTHTALFVALLEPPRLMTRARCTCESPHSVVIIHAASGVI